MRATLLSVLCLTAVSLPSCSGNGPSGPPPLPATKLGFLSQPGTVEGQVAWDPPIRVALQDASGKTVATASGAVTITVSMNPSGATLAGTTTIQAANGIATFTDLSLALPGDGFVLRAESPGLTPASGLAFSVRLTFTQASVGGMHSCGLTIAGFAYCWGQNAGGQLGTGAETSPRLRPVPVIGGLRFSQVSAGHVHTCGVTTVNAAYCWGVNELGRLGDGTTTQRAAPVAVAGGFQFAQVSAGEVHTCAVTTAGTAHCWGFSGNGRLGNPNITDASIPNPVAGALQFTMVSAGDAHSCGIATDSTGYCWGANDIGQLGDGTTEPREGPVAVSSVPRWRRLSAGRGHSCGVSANRSLYCWGWNNHGQLGDGTTTDRHAPIPILAGTEVVAVTTANIYTCAIAATGPSYCWGGNVDGQLGDSTFMSPRMTPTPVSGGLSLAQISGRASHTCGTTTARIAYCWGWNAEGQLGTGTDQSGHAPARVTQ